MSESTVEINDSTAIPLLNQESNRFGNKGSNETTAAEWQVLHEKIRFWERVRFVIVLFIVGVVLVLFEIIEPYEKIEIYAVALLIGYLILQFTLLHVIADEMLLGHLAQFRRNVSSRYWTMVIWLSVILIVSMVVHLKYSSPIAASIFMALVWRIGISYLSLNIFVLIDSFILNYRDELNSLISELVELEMTQRKEKEKDVESGITHQRQGDVVDELATKKKPVFEKINRYCYWGVGLCITSMTLFYILLYYFDSGICEKLNLIIYCTFVFVCCSTYFLLGMCELGRLSKKLPTVAQKHLKIKVKFAYWEPSGDLLVLYALGIIFKVSVNIIRLLRDHCH
jgi:lysylphosphatidylglycerol synthetase-like protein (DUF2156 family)